MTDFEQYKRQVVTVDSTVVTVKSRNRLSFERKKNTVKSAEESILSLKSRFLFIKTNLVFLFHNRYGWFSSFTGKELSSGIFISSLITKIKNRRRFLDKNTFNNVSIPENTDSYLQAPYHPIHFALEIRSFAAVNHFLEKKENIGEMINR
ncbi:MAG TPA: hypothetical protein PKX37_03225 [Flexilinea sp.]|nr:hypothetical protein [Flexilinea sp.]